jgi:hypothetical protein
MVWPAVHRVVVAIYATNAWKLGGFAMYATPPARSRVSIVEKPGSQEAIPIEGTVLTALMEQRRLYSVRRGVLGLLLPPDALAEAYFQARPDVDHFEVVITRDMLSARTARMERREMIYEYDRPSARVSRARGVESPESRGAPWKISSTASEVPFPE